MEQTYLRHRVADALNNQRFDEDILDLQLNMVMSAFAQLSSTASEDKDAPQIEVSAAAQHFSQRLLLGHFVVFRDPTDNITYYVKAHGYDLVAVFHPIGPWYNRYMAIASTESILVTLGITTPQFSDPKILDRIFGWNPEGTVQDVPIADVSPNNRAYWRWHIAGSPAIPAAQAVEIVAERNAEAPELRTVMPAAAPTSPDSIIAMASDSTQSAQTAMGAAFANLNQPRGTERRDGDRRGRSERRELAQAGGDQRRDPKDHRHEPPHAQVSEQVLDKAHEQRSAGARA